MATTKNTSSSKPETDRTFHYGMFKISEGIKTTEKLDQASTFLASAHEGISDMVASGDVNIDLLWGCCHMIETAKALLDSANAEVTEGGAA